MSDISYRNLERQYRATGDPNALDALIAAMFRIGQATEANLLITSIFNNYDLPYKYSGGVHQLPYQLINKNYPQATRSVMLFTLQEGAYLIDEHNRYNLNNIVYVRPPDTIGKLINRLPRRLGWLTPVLIDNITQYLETHPSISIEGGGRQPIRFMSSDEPYSFNPQSYLWNLRVATRSAIGQPFRATLNLVRSPFMDTLEFIVEDNLRWGSMHEVQGLRLSGDRYRIYGLGGEPDPEDDPIEYEQYEEATDYDSIKTLTNTQELIAGYIEELHNL